MTAPRANFEGLRSEWAAQLEVIASDVVAVESNRAIWLDMRPALLRTEAREFLDHYAYLYVVAQCMAVRRICDFDAGSGTISLGRLLTSIGANPAVLNRNWFVEKSMADFDGEARSFLAEQIAEQFDVEFGDLEGNFCTAKSEARTVELRDAVTGLNSLVDKALAHHDKRAAEEATFDQVDSAIDHISALVVDLYLLIRQESLDSLKPTPQSDWRVPFAVPLFPRTTKAEEPEVFERKGLGANFSRCLRLLWPGPKRKQR